MAMNIPVVMLRTITPDGATRMSDRSVSVLLKANVTGFLAGVEKAKLATRDFAADAQKSSAKHGQSWDKVGKGMLVTGGVIAAGVGLAVKSFMDFDASMSKVQAGTMTSGAALKSLRDAAIDAGAKTQFSATEAADAITAMGKAGVSTRDILGGGLNGALSLAAAGQLDVASASEIAATAMNQFGLQGKDIPHIADLLAAGAGKAMGSVEDLAGALKYVGPVAKGLGISIEETTGTLAMFAQAGIVGEQAGTSMRGMLTALTSPSKIASGAMEDLGIKMYDASGKFVGMQGVAGQLHDKLGPLSEATRNQALGQIFGNEQITAARVLYEGGAGAVDAWTKKTNDAGFAAMQAAQLTDNLKGDIERLSGSMSSVLIQSGSAVNGMFRGMTKSLQGVVDLYGSLPVPVQQGVTVLGLVAGAASLAAGGLLVLAPRITATKLALADMGRTGALISGGISKAGSAAKLMGGPLVLATVALGYFANKAQESKQRVDELAASLDQQTGAITDNTRAWVVKNLSDSGALASAKEMGASASDVTNAVLGNSAALTRVRAAMAAYAADGVPMGDSMSTNAEQANALKDAIGGGNSELKDGIAKTKLAAEANKVGAAATGSAAKGADGLTAAQRKLTAATEDTKKALDAEVQSLQDAGLVVLSTRSATRDLIQAQVDATAALHKNGKGLSNNTAKGRENAAALDSVASKALSLADSIYKETGSEAKMRASLVSSRGSLIKTYLQFDNNIGRARAYADSILKIPKQHLTKLQIDKAAADAKITTLQAKINAIKQGKVPGLNANSAAAKQKIHDLQLQIDALRGKTIQVKAGFSFSTANFPGKATTPKSSVFGGAGGGLLKGPGTGTSDSIMGFDNAGRHIANVSTDEYVVNAKQTARNLPLLEEINSGARGFASGGQVGSSINVKLPSLDAIRAALVIRVAAPPTASAGGAGGLSGIQGGGGGGQANLMAFARMLQGRSFQISEHPAFGGVTQGAHVAGSRHYSGRAIDVNHDQGNEMGALDAVVPLARGYGLRSIWRAPGHFNHAHFDYFRGGKIRGYGAGTASAAPGWAMVGEHGKEMVRFGGGEQVIPNHLAGGGLVQNFASGGFVSADFSGMSSGMSNPTIPSKASMAAALTRQQKATTALHVAENNLYTLRHTKGHTAAQIRIDEERLATARASLSTATRTLRGIEAARSGKPQPFVTQFHASAGVANRQTERFLANIGWLGRHGYHVLADQLLMAGDAQAYTLAEGAVKNAGTARSLQADMARSVKDQKALTTAQDAVNARYNAVPAQPAWALPTGVAASTYGARPAPARIQSIVVKIGDKELTTLISTTVDGHTQSLVDALVYGGGG